MIRGRHDVEKFASELGIELFPIKTEGHWLAFERNKTDPDPDILYLYDPGRPLQLKHENVQANALVKYGEVTMHIHWNHITKAALRKWILGAVYDSECIVCYEAKSNERGLTVCQQCFAAICGHCFVQLGMTPEFQDYFNSAKTDLRFLMQTECPGCREKKVVDIRTVYHHIHLDRYDNFSENIQRILRSLKEDDPNFEEKYNRNYGKSGKSKEKMRCFEKGCKVMLQGLKKEELNGQKAVITGERNMQNGQIRWPIQLLNGKKERASIKQCNLRKLKDFESKKIKKKRKKRKKK